MTVTLAEAKAKLDELLRALPPGEELLITENDKVIAKVALASDAKTPNERKLGTLKGTVIYMAEDFDAPLDDFKEYME